MVVKMHDIDESELQTELKAAQKVCRVIRFFLVGCLSVFVVGWLGTCVSLTVGLADEGLMSLLGAPFYIAVYGLIICFFLYKLIQIFTDVVKGNEPLSVEQAHRLRFLAVMLFLLFILDLSYSAGVVLEVIPQAGYNIIVNDGIEKPTINLNIGMLVFSAIMYSLSAIFRYAALLQQLSDETV
ncbi:hypothetical protein [Adlercreutzia equolifaciens]|uniref:DUF2975 domain-containing protein n=1 Tax=Adlercreutzia equolifaciens subsp. celatus DSM 18785 TaxID=1121021 RepID=A0A3N0AVR0_9ACTN|nr:hypothetical protein [Adlercreutzia equolifaciens]RFT91128.1 hypothetical protein DX904_10885 [Adlercreutzia equolifaciens subsp. celatus]RNL38609.1 hypothetical protein DMP10_03930 [Adlercreutzia equolifaciens subsp. celatus DSM 18785]